MCVCVYIYIYIYICISIHTCMYLYVYISMHIYVYIYIYIYTYRNKCCLTLSECCNVRLYWCKKPGCKNPQDASCWFCAESQIAASLFASIINLIALCRGRKVSTERKEKRLCLRRDNQWERRVGVGIRERMKSGVCFPHPCSSAGRMFGALRSRVHYYQRIVLFLQERIRWNAL